MDENSILIKNGNLKLISSNDPSLFLYSNLKDILVNNPINNNTQILIEKFLIDQFEKLFSEGGNENSSKNKTINVLGVDISRFTGGFKRYCINKRDDIKSYIQSLRYKLNEDIKLNKDLNKIKRKIDIFNYYFKLIINNIPEEKIMSCLFYSIFNFIFIF